jgi:ABC transporter substrate binding protein
VKRREFLSLLGAAAAWPLAAWAQQAGKLPTIGFLGASASIESQRVAAFVQRLRELAWIDGRNLAIEYRWAEGRNERYAEAAAELVRLKVDVIVTVATPATLAAKQATTVIPIVFGAASDPVGTGLVESLARPGGNVTGLSNQISDTGGKKLEFLREIVPGLRRLAILANVGNPAVVLDMVETQAAARKLGLEVTTSEIPAGGGHHTCVRRAQGPRGCTLCLYRPAREYPPHSRQHLGAGCTAADNTRPSRVR